MRVALQNAEDFFGKVSDDAAQRWLAGSKLTSRKVKAAIALMKAQTPALLLPEEALRSAVTRRQTDTTKLATSALFDIARDFDVSIDALIWRLHSIYGVKDGEYTRARIEALHEVSKLYEERQQETPPTRPERFRALAITTLRAGEISTGRFAEYLGISRGDAMKYVESEGPADEALELSPS